MRLTRIGATVGAGLALAAMFTLAACSDDSAPGKVDLSGAYEVTGYGVSAPSETPVVNPASGTADITSTNYTITITGVATSTGTYDAFDNGTFEQDGTVTPVGGDPFDAQCTGTYSVVSEVTTIDVTCSGVRSITRLAPLD